MSERISREEAKDLIDDSEVCILAVGSIEHIEGARYELLVDGYLVGDDE